jgi:hypothetical protein
MSSELLETLKEKKEPEKLSKIKILISRKIGERDTPVIKLTDDYNDKNFRERLREKNKLLGIKLYKTVERIVKEKKVKKMEKRTRKLVSEFSKQPSKTKKPRVKMKPDPMDFALEIDPRLIVLNGEVLKNRLPKKKEHVIVKASKYYMNNREVFINFINSMFRNYRREILKDKKSITCASIEKSKQTNFSLLIHQSIVRDYINLFTPYRGLLLYHGLGAGKTCASIAIAEGIKSEKEVIIMTPASLEMNYRQELRLCGDSLYKRNQFWEFIKITDNLHHVKALSEILSLSERFIKRQKGVWLVNVNKESNYDTLNNQEKKHLENQIDKMINAKYKFIHYNGLRRAALAGLETEAMQKYGRKNPFDNKIIVIDEAHNFVGRITNKLNDKKSLSYKLYEYIMDAENTKLVFLSGTPIINYPNEIAVLYNMLRGYIKSYNFPIDISEETSKQKINQEYVKNILKKINLIDYINFDRNSNMLVVTRNPFEFVNRYRNDKYLGVQRDINSSDTEKIFQRKIISALNKHGLKIRRNAVSVDLNMALPHDLNEFKKLFINVDNGEMKNNDLFRKRILGLTSYFKSAQESLLPEYNPERDLKVIELPMSSYQLKVYEEARVSERKEKKQSNLYGKSQSSYRTFSRVFCNFVFPGQIQRPMPNKEETLQEVLKKKSKTIDEDGLDNANVKELLDNVDGRFTADDIKKIEKNISENTDTSYTKRIQEAIQLLKDGYVDKGGQRHHYLKGSNLKQLSPKFANILEKLTSMSYDGLHLLYSQFRTVEGIGIFKAVLELNGFTQFKIKKDNSGIWRINIKKEDLYKPKFCLYTGTEEREEKEIMRNIFNSTWDKIPPSLAEEIIKLHPNNFHGEIIKLLMITSSGAEGITLKNVRYVHLLEPYWHPVRTEQVIGRAVRICSHQDLEKDEQNVTVFLYLMKLTDKQINGNPTGKTANEQKPEISKELRRNDRSRIDESVIITTDQSLHEISTLKSNINKNILLAIKESSFDCALHKKPGSKENIACYSISRTNPDTFTFTDLNVGDDQKDDVANVNKEKIKWKAIEITIKGVKRVLRKKYPNDPKSKLGVVYDKESFDSGKLIVVGKIIEHPKTKKINYIPSSTGI